MSVVPLEDGIAPEALTIMYALFGQSRGILRSGGPTIAQPPARPGTAPPQPRCSAGCTETHDGVYETARTAAQCLRDEATMAWITPPDGARTPGRSQARGCWSMVVAL